ncbi:MAG: DMT family transporter [Methylococcales bacterium]|nr:DMT family transporter [Methylococcales bacterium]
MRILLAYISLILLWSTTPLAIQWSSKGVGFLFGSAGRMVIGLICVSVFLLLMRQPLVWYRKALLTYLAVATQLYASMMIVYWASQFIPSGWVSVVFGLAPLMTAIIAALYLGERSLTLGKMGAYIFGLGGLVLMFGSALQLGHAAVWAVTSLLIAVLLQTGSAVWVKQINAQLPAMVQVAGGLCFAVPLYVITWWVWDGQWPTHVPIVTLGAIFYLGVLATTFGFALYYYILKYLAATRVALISLVSPVLALLLGHNLNHEPLTLNIMVGVGFILFALVLHEFADYRLRRAMK